MPTPCRGTTGPWVSESTLGEQKGSQEPLKILGNAGASRLAAVSVAAEACAADRPGATEAHAGRVATADQDSGPAGAVGVGADHGDGAGEAGPSKDRSERPARRQHPHRQGPGCGRVGRMVVATSIAGVV